VIFRSLPFSGRESNPSSYYYVGFFFLSLSLLLNGNFDTARGGKESTEAQARNRLQIISLDTAGLCNPHGRDFFYLFIFFSFQLHRGFPPPPLFSIFPPLGFYRIATLPTHEIPEVERVDNKSNTEKSGKD
jgi:hypothetical protein